MTAPVTMTRVDVGEGHVVVDIELMGTTPIVLDVEQAAQLRARLADAVEGVFEAFWSVA